MTGIGNSGSGVNDGVPHNPFALAPLLRKNGYSPTCLIFAAKRPWQEGWSRLCHSPYSDDELAQLLRQGPWNLGVAGGYGGLVLIDVDLDDPAFVAAVNSVLPDSPVKRRGSRGWAGAYRTLGGHGHPLKSAKLLGRDGTHPVLEIISAGGQVVLPPSLHPDTRRPYEWLTKRTLLDTRPEELPIIDDDIEEQFRVVLTPWLKQEEPAPPFQSKRHRGSRRFPPDVDRLVEPLSALDPSCDQKTWDEIGKMINAEDCGEVGFRVYDEWSKRSSKYPGERELRKRWARYRPEKGLKPGSLIQMARNAGWTPSSSYEQRWPGFGRSANGAHHGPHHTAVPGKRADSSDKNEAELQHEQDEEPKLRTVGDYRETSLGIDWLKRGRESDTYLPLTNFRARIIADVTIDDGVERTRSFEMEVTIGDRAPVVFLVAAAQFANMNWAVEHLGAEAVVQPGQGSKDRARAAIQILSQTVRKRFIYAHTGWRDVDGEHVYLHAGGALGAKGPVAGIEVRLPEELQRYVLPHDDVDKGKLKAAVQASLELRKLAPDNMMVPLIAAPYRAVLGGADYSHFLSGPTGLHKTGVAAVIQQHVGAGMTERAPPANWSSTANQLEMVASSAKDTPLLIDEYVPGGAQAERARANDKADRVLRGQGNLSGRGRLRPDGSIKRSRPPAGLIIATGEEVPLGQSLRARMIINEVAPGDVNIDELTDAQEAAEAGVYAYATAGYIRWLAPKLDETRRKFTSAKNELRNKIGGGHDRTADNLAQVAAAWNVLLEFAIEAEAVTAAEAEAIKAEVLKVVNDLAAQQQELQRVSDPVHRFFALLNGVISSGRGHLEAANGGRPPNAKAFGWKLAPDGVSWHTQGACIGWWADDGIYLEPEAAFAEVQRMGVAMGEPVGVSSTALHRRLFDRKLIGSERRGKKRHLTVRKTVGGKRHPVLYLYQHDLIPYLRKGSPSSPSGPSLENSDENQELE
jgi:hypothetical protein